MTTAVTNGAVAPETGAPPPDPDAAKWAALEAELATEEGEEAEPEATPEPVAEPKAAEPEVVEPKPKPTYDELETNYRNTQTALQQARTKQRQADERLTGITEFIQGTLRKQQPAKEEPEAPAIPDINEDPIGHFQARTALLEQKLEEAYKGNQTTQQHVQQSEQQRAFVDHVVRSEEAIRNPKSPTYKADYDEACQHLGAGRVAELAIMYPDNSPQAQAVAQQYGMPSPAELRNAILNQDRIAVATQALQMGVSPAEMYYSLATQRGYRTPATNGALKSPAEKAAAMIAATRKGQKAAVTISGGGGGKKSVGDMSIADLTDLYDEDPEAADKVFAQMAKNGLLG